MKRKIPPQNINQKRKKDDKKESEKKKRVVKRERKRSFQRQREKLASVDISGGFGFQERRHA